MFGRDDQPDLPDHIEYDDGTPAYMAEAFAHVIGRAIEQLMRAVQT